MIQYANQRKLSVSIEQTFTTLQTFVLNSSAIKNTLSSLKAGTEFGITIGHVVQCALTMKDGEVVFEKRPAVQPDLIFYVKPESVAVVTGQNADQIATLGAAVMKEILAGNIHVELTSNFRALLDHGYIDILRRTGAQWSNQVIEVVTQQAFTHAMKASAALENVKKALKLDGK
jgi:hypothetical protein